MKLPEWLMDLVVAAHARAIEGSRASDVEKKLTAFLHHRDVDVDLFDGNLGQCPTDLEAIKIACGVIGTKFVQRDAESATYSYLFINPRPSLTMIAARTSIEDSPLETVLIQADSYLEFDNGELVSC